ncbi:unnamed protein product, partial [Polarella glacialis]
MLLATATGAGLKTRAMLTWPHPRDLQRGPASFPEFGSTACRLTVQHRTFAKDARTSGFFWKGAAVAAAAAAPAGRSRLRTRLGAASAGGPDKLERFLSKAGVLSREQARVKVREGIVKVNGRVVKDPWLLVSPGSDKVEVKDIGIVRLVDWEDKPPLVVVFNKPQDVLVTMRSDDPGLEGRKSINEALVGLLLLTDSSGLSARLLEPGTCEKEYLLRVSPAPGAVALSRLREGIDIRDGNSARGLTKPCQVDVVETAGRESAVLRFAIQEGRNRQLRRMCADVGLDVEWLMRLRIGTVRLGKLPLGQAREVTKEELASLLKSAGPLPTCNNCFGEGQGLGGEDRRTGQRFSRQCSGHRKGCDWHEAERSSHQLHR